MSKSTQKTFNSDTVIILSAMGVVGIFVLGIFKLIRALILKF